MKYVATEKVPVIFQKDLPAISEYGFSVYMGVIARWDEDYSSRIDQSRREIQITKGEIK